MNITADKPPLGEDERRNQILDLAEHERYKPYLSQTEVSGALRNGWSVERVKDLVMDNMASRHTDTRDMHIGMTNKEAARYSLCRAISAAISGDWREAGLERESSRAVEKLFGRPPEGFYVPYEALRDFTVGTASEAGNLVATDFRTDLFTDVLRNALVVGRLGVRILGGLTSNIDIPRKITPTALAMVTEIQALTEGQPVTAKVSLAPKRVGAFVEYSKQAIIQSALAIEPMLRADLLDGVAVQLEQQLINGTGTSPQIRGIRNTSGVGSVVGGTNGLTLAWTHVVGLESACANVNAEPDRLAGYLSNTKVRGTAKQIQKAANLPFIWDNGEQPLNGYRAAVTNNVPSNLTKGTSSGVCSSAVFSSDWSMEVMALFGAPDITVDPFTLATTGMVRITLNQFADAGCRQPGAFSVIDDLLTL